MEASAKRYYREIASNGKVVYRINGPQSEEIESDTKILLSWFFTCLEPLEAYLRLCKRHAHATEQYEDAAKVEVALRLYDAAWEKLEELEDVIDRDIGTIYVTAEDVDGRSFASTPILGAHITKP